MNCKGCNTRLPSGTKSCPACGAEVRGDGNRSTATRATVLPAPELSTARDSGDDCVELDEMTDEQPTEPPAPARAAAKKKKKIAIKPPAPKPVVEASPMFATDVEGLRALLAAQPDTLEAGLEVYSDSEGTPLGASYASGVGDIDLLARSRKGELVVVMISEASDEGENLVAEVLQRVGWVRKHVASGDERVRGIVLCEQAPESLIYTAAAVADTVRFKTYRVALSFDDLEI